MEKTSLGAQHISTSLANYEAARSAFFTLIVDDIDNLIKATYTGAAEAAQDSDKIGSQAQKTLQLNVLSTKVPHFTVNVLEYKRGNEVVKFAGTPTFESGSIVVDDVIGLDTKSILMAWQAKTYNVHSGKGGRMVDYKKDCTLIEYTQDYVPVRQWKLVGCFISGISEEDFDKENDSKRKISCTVEYDRAIPQEIS